MEEEIWREVEDNPDYLISNKNGWHNTKTKREQPKGRIVQGYRVVGLGREKGEKQYHNLVAKAFPEICGEWFEGCQVHHKDFDKLNNVPENLIVLTPSEHSALHYKTQPDSFKKSTEKRIKAISKALTGRISWKRHIPVLQYTLDGEFVKRWECLMWIDGINEKTGKKWDISNICSCCKGQIKTAYGYIWKYEKEADD